MKRETQMNGGLEYHVFCNLDFGFYVRIWRWICVDCENDPRDCCAKIYLHVLPDLESLTVDKLNRRGLSDSGNKADLVARL
jgi:hypothetical protein